MMKRTRFITRRVIDELKKRVNGVIWKKLGTYISDNDFGYMDVYIRPARHDGMPRIVLRCEIEGIPYKYSNNFEPNIEEFEEWINVFKAFKSNADI